MKSLWKNFLEYQSATANLPSIGLLETMATFSCTLSCKSCNNYSDYGMRGGYVRWQQMQEWLDVLFTRLRVSCFSIVGGEPFLNPELQLWIESFRQRYPETMLMILTNATLLDKNWWIIDSMKKYGMIYLKMTNHQPHLSYFEKAKEKLLSSFNWEQHEENYWFEPTKILDLRIEQSSTFMKTFKGSYGSMKPYNNNPIEAFEICNQKICPLFVDGKLFKCGTAGLLHRVLQDHNQLNDVDWAPYVNKGLKLDCTDEELRAWANNYGKPHSICSMCPAANDNPFHSHFATVESKIILK
jgi:hypothetical protein